MFNPREKSMSFHGRTSPATPEKIRRPKTMPELLSSSRMTSPTVDLNSERRKLTKVLLNVTVQGGGVGPVQVLISPQLSVNDLINATLKQYVKEGRRPMINNNNFVGGEFDLHYSQFSLESLDRDEKLLELGSRNFFLCKRKLVVDGGDNGDVTTVSCSKQAEKATKLASLPPWLNCMNFLL